MNRCRALLVLNGLFLSTGSAIAAEVYNDKGNVIDIYGQLRGLRYFSDDPAKNGDNSYYRGGIVGETQIGNQLTGYGKWEFQVQGNSPESDDGNNMWTRLAYTGIKSEDYGSFDYGRNNGILFDVRKWAEVMPDFIGETYSKTDNYMTYRASGLATYRNENMFGLVDGLKMGIQYQGANDKTGSGESSSKDIRNENGNGWGTSLTYDTDWGGSVAAAYSSSDRSNDQYNRGSYDNRIAAGKKADAWALGVKYDRDNLYLAASYAETRNMTPYGKYSSSDSSKGGGVAENTQNIEFVMQYMFDVGLQPSIAYMTSKGNSVWNTYSQQREDKALVKFMQFSVSYYFNKNMLAYVDYKVNLLDAGDDFYRSAGIPTDDVVAIGLVYRF
jgi:outer membrane protein N